MTSETARAKVNLCLHVTGRRADGYHLLDSLVVFADLGDRLSFAPADRLSLKISGPFAGALSGGGDNLVLRAARLTGAPVAIDLDKRLPVAGGIGGGSADAAACLRGLGALGYGRPGAQEILALGADVPVCLDQETARMRGIGDRIDRVAGWPPLPAVLINPGVPVSTPDVFHALERRDNPPLEGEPPDWLRGGDPVGWLARQRNDLEAPAMRLVPALRETLDGLRRNGARLARMSGSGATCFGIFESAKAADDAARALARPGWWVRALTLG